MDCIIGDEVKVKAFGHWTKGILKWVSPDGIYFFVDIEGEIHVKTSSMIRSCQS